MLLLINTSDAVCRTSIVKDDRVRKFEWEAGRSLADGLLRYLESTIAEVGETWDSIEGIGVFKGPGSFTGLRIGLTVMNTIANARNVPIVGAQGEGWADIAKSKLRRGEDDKIVLPEYGRPATITKPRK